MAGIEPACYQLLFQHVISVRRYTPIRSLNTGETRGCLTGLEPATSGTTNQRSNQLSYRHHIRSQLMRFTLIDNEGIRNTTGRV